MAALTRVGHGNFPSASPSSSETSMNPTLPSGTQVGDLLLLVYTVNRPVSSTSSYFYPNNQAAWTSQASNYSTLGSMQVWSKIATAADISLGYVACTAGSVGGQPTFGALVTAFRGPAIRVDGASGQAQSTSTAPVNNVKTDATGVVFSSQAYTYGGGSGSPTGPSGWSQYMISTGYPNMAYYVAPTRTASAGTQPALPTGGTFDYLSVYLNGNVLPSAPTWAAALPADGSVVDRSQPFSLGWVPVDPDGDAQVGYDIQARLAGTYSWVTLVSAPAGGAVPSFVFPSNTFAGDVEFAVRTYDAIGSGPWSTATRTLKFRDLNIPGTSAPSSITPEALSVLVRSQRALYPAV